MRKAGGRGAGGGRLLDALLPMHVSFTLLMGLPIFLKQTIL